MKPALSYSLMGLVLVAFILSLDRQGVFIYFTYLPVYVLGVLYIGWGLRLIYASAASRRPWPLLIAATLTGMIAVAAPHLPNGARKEFFLKASSIQRGTPEAKIRAVMRDYRLTENANGSLTFSFRAGPQTEDHFVVVLDPAASTARSVEFLAD